MKIKNIAFSALIVAAVSLLSSCNEFLEKDPSKSTQRTIETADQLDALLGTFSRFYSEYNHTALACDDFGLTTDIHDHQSGGMSPSNLEYILWNDECTSASRLLWGNEYSKIYYANLVLAYIDEVSGTAEQKANLKAEAHFLRAYSMFQLAVAYTLYYDGTNGDEPGLTLKQTISFEEGIARASLKATWDFIDADLQEALKSTMPLVSNGKRRVWRGTTAAIHAFAARYYLYRGDFENALTQVEAVLKEYSTLKDFNTTMYYSQNDDVYTINSSTKEEVVYVTYAIDAPDGDPMNDLRYEYFIAEDFSLRYCDKDPAFRYPGFCQFFYDNIISGPTVAEMLLIKAEIQARQGNWQEAMETIDPLRQARIKASAYTKLTASSQADAIRKILQERRREMPFTIRWYDLKRLNANDDPSDDVTITRVFYPYNSSAVMNNDPVQTYTLEPGSRHYALPIPNTELDLAKGEIVQNTY